MAKIEILDSEDWVVVLVDGKRVQAEHTVRVPSLLESLGHEVTYRYGAFGTDYDGDDTLYKQDGADETVEVPE